MKATRRESIGFWVIALISLTFIVIVDAAGKCSSLKFDKQVNSNDQAYLKNVLEKLAEKKYKSSERPNRFEMSVCEALTVSGVSDPKAGLVEVDKKSVIGKFDEVTAGNVGESSSSIYFRYGGGDKCKNSSYQAVVNVVCDRAAPSDILQFTGPEDACILTFTLATKLLCDIPRSPPVTAPPATAPPATTTTTASAAAAAAAAAVSTVSPTNKSSSHMSPFTGFILFLLALACGYCVIGFLYKRYVLGARGAQQIPNYLFWIRVSQSVQDCISNRSSTRYSTSTSRTAEYDRANAADVQLMNDGEDFKYDQPPLTVGPGAGQSSNFRQQPLNVVPSGNTPSLNAQRQQQQQPLLLPQDDADERLLQV